MPLTFALAALSIYIAIMLAMFLLQRKLMYHPVKMIHPPEHYGLTQAEILHLNTRDNLRLHAWHIKPKQGFPLIIYFHGNAGHIGDRAEKLRHFHEAGFGILAVSYRGFGHSHGTPTEKGLYEDAHATIHYAQFELGYNPSHILLYGESLGSGIATHTAKVLADQNTPAAGLILEAPYTSVAGRSQEMYPFIPARHLVRDKYHSIDKIAHIKCPLLLFHGEQDVVIPIHHGKALLEKALGEKRGEFFAGVGHTDFHYPTLTEHLIAFGKKYVK